MSERNHPLALGIDYGTASGRVLVLDLVSGKELAAVDVAYTHGVIEERLPGTNESLRHDWALQHPADYLDVVWQGIPLALQHAEADPSRVIGLGIDFTSCTVLPVDASGKPLCLSERWASRPHAWPKLWKHHAAQPQADRMTSVAQERKEDFLTRYGGRISSEWYFPKLLEVYEQDLEVYAATDRFIEATDWVVWQLTGVEARGACAASYKAFWSTVDGLPSPEYFEAVASGFAASTTKLGTSFHPLGARAGTVIPNVAERLGLHADVAVAVGNVDSFVSVPGAGVESPGVFVTVIGTSICDMVVDSREVRMPGITGVVRDGIIPGFYGYEAGQPAVGDMLGWYVEELLGIPADTRGSRFDELEHEAAQIAPGATGLMVLNWWNGNRSVLADADLSGVIAGFTLATTAADVYRGLLESIAFSARRIIDNFEGNDVPVERIVACGGIAQKSPTLMQIFADVTGRSIAVPASTQVPARGAAMFGAVAAGPQVGGFADISTATAALHPEIARVYDPNQVVQPIYDRTYAVHRGLHDALGVSHRQWLHQLKQVRHESVAPTPSLAVS